MKITVDDREPNNACELISSFIDCECVRERIEIGDYLIKRADDACFTVERKTWVDLAASIRDGRIKRQEVNMRNDCRFFVIEGKLPKMSQRIGTYGVNCLYGKLISLSLRGSSLMFTSSFEDTCRFIALLAKRKDTDIEIPQSISPSVEFWKKLGAADKLAQVLSRHYAPIELLANPTLLLSDNLYYESGRSVSKTTITAFVSRLSALSMSDVLLKLNGIGRTRCANIMKKFGESCKIDRELIELIVDSKLAPIKSFDVLLARELDVFDL